MAAISGLPSPSKSPMLTEDACPAEPKSTFAEKLTVPDTDVLRKTETEPPVKFATDRSGFPFPSMSPMLTIWGAPPAAKSTLAAKLPASIIPGVEVLRNTDALLQLLLATARSGLPSPSMSPMLIETGPLPALKSTFAAKFTPPVVEVFLYTYAVLSPLLATARSGLLSPSRSPMLTE